MHVALIRDLIIFGVRKMMEWIGLILSENKVLNWTMERNGFSEQQGKGYVYGTAFPLPAFPKFATLNALLLLHGFCFLRRSPAL